MAGREVAGGRRLRPVAGTHLSLDEAVELSRTGDIWLFRGHTLADRAIRASTNSPVNHVGMAVVLDDLPPLMWHAELGRSLPDLWSGSRHRGVQLHDLRDAVVVWATRYGQRAWLRQLQQPVTATMEDAVLRCIARLDGTPFPSTATLAARWLRGRLPAPRRQPGRSGPGGHGRGRWVRWAQGRWERLGLPGLRGPHREAGTETTLETAYCAEVVAATYQAMGLLPAAHGPSWYDPGRFWSGDDLQLCSGYTHGNEIPVHIPLTTRIAPRPARPADPADPADPATM